MWNSKSSFLCQIIYKYLKLNHYTSMLSIFFSYFPYPEKEFFFNVITDWGECLSTTPTRSAQHLYKNQVIYLHYWIQFRQFKLSPSNFTILCLQNAKSNIIKVWRLYIYVFCVCLRKKHHRMKFHSTINYWFFWLLTTFRFSTRPNYVCPSRVAIDNLQLEQQIEIDIFRASNKLLLLLSQKLLLSKILILLYT